MALIAALMVSMISSGASNGTKWPTLGKYLIFIFGKKYSGLLDHSNVDVSLKFGSVQNIHELILDNTVDVAFF